MATSEEQIRVVYKADGTAELADGTRLTAEEVKRLGDALDKTSQHSDRLGQNASKAGEQLAGLGRDIAQGDWRGAAENMARVATSTGALQAAATGTGALLGGVALAVGALAVAMYQGRAETQRQADALILTGNAAGLVGGQLNQMARDTSSSIGGTVGNVRQTMEGLVATGRVSVQSLDAMARGVELVTRYSGQSREAVTSNFASMANGVADWAAKTNDSYHFITYEQYKYIEALELAGNKQEAMRVTSEALSQHLGGDLTRNMGILEKSWTAIQSKASQAWDAMLNIGRPDSLSEQLKKAQQALDDEVSSNARSRRKGPEDTRNAELRVQAVRDEIENIQELMRMERRAADDRSRRAEEEQAKIAADRDKKKKADDGDSTYERLNSQVKQRLTLAQAEEAQNGKLSASERYRLEGLQQISDVEAKIGPRRADQLRSLINETAEILKNNEQREENNRIRQRHEAALEKEFAAQEREINALQNSNASLELQIESVGKTKDQVNELKAARIEQAIATERENLANEQATGGNERQVQLIERRISLLERQAALTRELGSAQAAEETRAKAEAENKKYAEELRRDLTHALQSAFNDGSKDPLQAFGSALENTIKVRASRAIAESLMNAIMRPVEQGFSSWLSGLSSGSSSGGSGNGGTGGADLWVEESAKGNVYRSPGLSAYSGTIVDRPTVFPFARGAGLMGEAGPEAILPLKRNGQGVLGVQMQGGGGGGVEINLSVINNSGTPVSAKVKQRGGMDFDVILDAVDAGMADRLGSGEGSTSRALEGRYGLKPVVT